MKRRDFLKSISSAAGLIATGPIPGWSNPTTPVAQGLPRRRLGGTGHHVSIVGFPGLALVHYDQQRCNLGVRQAWEGGLNLFDVAPAYGNGQCESKLGVALQGIDRGQYFLACKTKKRDAEGAQQELENSLRALRTDHFDLYQLHHLVQVEEVQQALGPGGALEAILKARDQGKVRWVGFSAHTTRAALEALRTFSFDTVMFPINFVEYYNRGFGREVLTLAAQRQAAVLSIKPMSYGSWPPGAQRHRQWWYRSVESIEDVELALRFALSQPGVVTCFPPAFMDLLDRAMEAAKRFKPLDEVAEDRLKAMATNCAGIFLREDQQAACRPPTGDAWSSDPTPWVENGSATPRSIHNLSSSPVSRTCFSGTLTGARFPCVAFPYAAGLCRPDASRGALPRIHQTKPIPKSRWNREPQPVGRASRRHNIGKPGNEAYVGFELQAIVLRHRPIRPTANWSKHFQIGRRTQSLPNNPLPKTPPQARESVPSSAPADLPGERGRRDINRRPQGRKYLGHERSDSPGAETN
ncbi:MAG: aldo/keto reductase [Limisphaera sp.]|nr:aldo/keto reductase [Limisphaera sp.]